MKSGQPGKQRKAMYTAPLHKKRKNAASHLEESLLLKYDRRSMPIVKGDTVKVMRGSYKGHEDKVAHVNVKKNYLEIENATMMKADGTKIAKPIHPSNVLITKLNLTDKWRRGILERKVSEETKKVIEKEAAEQLKEQEEEQKRLEKEQKEREAQEAKEAEEAEQEPSEETPAKPIEKPAAKKPTPAKPKQTPTKKDEKPAAVKKPAPKKTAKKKPAAKKASSSTSSRVTTTKKPAKKTTKKEEKA